VNYQIRELHNFYLTKCSFILSVKQQPKSGLDLLVVEISRSHTQTVGLLWTSDQPLAEAATYTTNNKHKRWTYMPSAGFKPSIPAIKRS